MTVIDGVEQQAVNCAAHGETQAAFVCRHLVGAVRSSGPAIGFNEPSPLGDEPQAWCAECDTVYLDEGEWNDVSEGFAGVTLICSGCFADLKQTHTQIVKRRSWFARLLDGR